MDSGTGITPVVNMGNDGGAFGCGNAFLYIFGLLILLGMFSGGFGGFGNNTAAALGYENLATSSEVQRGFDAQNSAANEREILSAVNSGTAQNVAAVGQAFHDTAAVVNDRYSELQRDVSNLAVGQANSMAGMNQCCGNIRLEMANQCAGINAGVAKNNYDAAMRDAATNANFTAQIQSVKDMISQNKIDTLQAQVSQLQLAQATSGVLRFPNSWSYGAGPFPPIFGGCGCGATA